LPPEQLIVLFVLDPTGHCGFTIDEQMAIRSELRARFPSLRWLDLVSKSDLGDSKKPVYRLDLSPRLLEDGQHKNKTQLPDGLRVSTANGVGLAELQKQLRKLIGVKRLPADVVQPHAVADFELVDSSAKL